MDKVKQKIIELVPSLKNGGKVICGCGYREDAIIQLADVLRAIEKSGNGVNVSMATNGNIGYWFDDKKDLKNWNLTTDYDHQTQEVKDFIGRLLGVNK